MPPSSPPTSDQLQIELFESGRVHEVDVVGIDEVQFFDTGITPLALELVHLGKRVILAGLDTTFANEPFGPVPTLMALSDEVTKLSAVCMVCGAPAIHTQRLGQSQELVVVGAAGLYEARCRTHFHPYLDEHHSQQLDPPHHRHLASKPPHSFDLGLKPRTLQPSRHRYLYRVTI